MQLTKTASGKTTVKISKKEWERIGQLNGWEGEQDLGVNAYLPELASIIRGMQSVGREASQMMFESDEYYSEHPEQLAVDLKKGEALLLQAQNFSQLLQDDLSLAQEGIRELKNKFGFE